MNKNFMKSYTLNKTVEEFTFWEGQKFECRELTALDFEQLNTTTSEVSMLVDTVMAGTFDPETGEKVFTSQEDRDFLMGMRIADLSEVVGHILPTTEEIESGKDKD